MRTRDVAPHADDGREVIVAGRAIDEHAEAGVGKTRTAVLDHRVDDLAVAAFHQQVGDCLAQRFALRDREEVELALAAGVGEEGAFVQTFRQAEHRRRDLDVVVEREHLDRIERSVGNRGQPVRQLGARFRLDRTDEAHHDVIEHAGLRLGKARRAADEKIGDAREHFDVACTGAAGERGLELFDDRKGLHALACRHIIETPTTMPRER